MKRKKERKKKKESGRKCMMESVESSGLNNYIFKKIILILVHTPDNY